MKLIPPKDLPDLGIPFSNVYRLRLEKEGRFPRRVRIVEGGKSYGYVCEEVTDYLSRRVASRDTAA